MQCSIAKKDGDWCAIKPMDVSVDAATVSKSLEQWQHRALCWVLQVGLSPAGLSVGKTCTPSPTFWGDWGSCHCKSHLGADPGLLWKAKGWKSKGLDLLYFLCISCVAAIVGVKIILLTCSCFHLMGCEPRDSRTHQSSDAQSGAGCRVWPQAVVPGWHRGASHQPPHHGWVGCALRAHHSPWTSHCVPVLTDVKQQLLLHMCFALLMAQVSCAESCPKSPGIPWAGRGNSLPCLPLPLEHLMWPNIPWSHLWQVYSPEFLVSLQQDLMDAIWKKPEDMAASLCAHLCASFSVLV